MRGRQLLTAAFLGILAFQAWLLLLPQGAELIGDSLEPVAIGAAAVAMTRAAHRLRGRDRMVWTGGAIGMSLWCASQALDAVNRHAGQEVIPKVICDIPNWLAFLVALGALLAMPAAPDRLVGKIRMALDGVIITASLLGIAWLAVLGPMFRQAAGAQVDTVTLSYVVGSTVVLAVSLLLISGSRGVDATTVFSAGIGVTTLLNIGGTLLKLYDSPYQEVGKTGLLLLGVLLMGTACRLPLPQGTARTWDPSTLAGRALPYLPVVAVLLFAGVVMARDGMLHPFSIWVGFVLVATVMARQFLSLWLNSRLTAELSEQRARLAHQASHDPLTGLANRTVLRKRMAASTAGGGSAALLLIDLDGFKAVNDTLGHNAGDMLLVAVAQRLRAGVRGRRDGLGDMVARLGGDEFAILLDGVTDSAVAAAVGERVLAELAHPVPIDEDGREPIHVDVRASIGIAVAGPADHSNPGRLLRDADLALYAAKADGKGRVRLSDAELTDRALRELRLDGELRAALDRREFEVHYQPIVDLDGGAVIGAEALVRWIHPQRGMVAPDQFLPIAEASGLILDIDRWVLGEACRQATHWWRQDPTFSVSVNISARHLAAGTLVEDVAAALRDSGLPAGALVLELTETAVVADMAVAAQVLTQLTVNGVRVALDDFGTGYASLTYLRTLPIDTIKIDQSFVQCLGDDATGDALTRAIVGLAGTLGIRQVAEGVETVGQASQLRELSCTYGQGFLFARPMPAPELSRVLLDQRGAGHRPAPARGDRSLTGRPS